MSQQGLKETHLGSQMDSESEKLFEPSSSTKCFDRIAWHVILADHFFSIDQSTDYNSFHRKKKPDKAQIKFNRKEGQGILHGELSYKIKARSSYEKLDGE